jgi:DNA-nicking Smr family endonuclease
MYIDLHGKSVHDGWQLFKNAVSDCYFKDCRSMIVVTGKGKMKEEFSVWCFNHSFIREHKLRRDGGSFIVKVKKKKQF